MLCGKAHANTRGRNRSRCRSAPAGWLADEDILDINLIIASYFNFVNRIADGLGVEFTLEEVQGYRY